MKKNKFTILQFLATTLFVGLFLIGNSTVAIGADTASSTPTDGKYTVLAPLPCIEGGGITCGTKGNGSLQTEVDFKTYVQYTINLLIGLSAVVAVVMIVWGGIEYMYTASFSGKKMGLEKVTHAIYGLVLILTSYIILRTIDPRLVEIPNTIVPKIKIEKWLQEDVTAILMNEVLSDIDKTAIRNIAISKKIESINAEKTAAAIQKASINEQIEALDPSDPDFETKITKLEVAKHKIESKESDLEGLKQTETAKILFNEIYTAAITKTLNSGVGVQEMSPQERIKVVTNEEKILEQKRLNFVNNLIVNGQYDASEINATAETIKTKLEVYKINISAASARDVSEGATYQTKIVTQLVLIDGSIKTFKTKNEAKQYLLNQLETIKTKKSSVKDAALLLDLQQQIDDATKRINTNNMLGGK